MNIHYNETALLGVLKNVYEFIRTPITVYDENFRYVTHYSVDSLGQYCRLIRESEENQQRCKKSDDEACARCRASKQRESYRCYAGLNETVMPIRYNDMLLGYIMFGKYRLLGEDIDIGKYAESLGVDKDKLGRACEELSVLTPEQVEAASELLRACIIQFCVTDVIFLKESERAEEIKKYIDNNLTTVSIEIVCRRFLISRRQLYNIFISAFGVTVKRYILEKKMEEAKHLLLTTTLTVTEIAASVGFADYNNFIQRFKQMVGITPAAYRNATFKNE